MNNPLDGRIQPQTDDFIQIHADRCEFLVNRNAFVDPDILKMEREVIFKRCWLYACHASEIAAPGDFLSRRVGGRQLILVRDDAGEVRAASVYRMPAYGAALPCRFRLEPSVTPHLLSVSGSALPRGSILTLEGSGFSSPRSWAFPQWRWPTSIIWHCHRSRQCHQDTRCGVSCSGLRSPTAKFLIRGPFLVQARSGWRRDCFHS